MHAELNITLHDRTPSNNKYRDTRSCEIEPERCELSYTNDV
jgi:hypothetical protein